MPHLTAAEHLDRAETLIASLDADHTALGLSRELQCMLAGLHIAAASAAAQIRIANTEQNIAEVILAPVEAQEESEGNPWPPLSSK